MIPEGYVENYEKIAADYAEAVSIETQAISKLVDYTIQILGISREARMVDLGCGNGWILGHSGNVSPVAVDISHLNCKLTTQNTASTKAIQADAQNIPLQNESFDLVVCTDLIEHVPHPTAVVQEIMRILRPGGVLIFGCPFEQDLSYYQSSRYKRRYRYVHLRSVTRDLLVRLFSRFTKLGEFFVTEHMYNQDEPYPIIFQVYAKRG